jgi:tetratricopeptide (TPR) repeat protein
MLTSTATDAHGNPTSGATETITRYDMAVDRLLRYDEAVVEQMGSLVTDDPTFPMGQVMAAYMHLISTDRPDLAGARDAATVLRALPLNDREAAHADAIDAWLAGDWHRASSTLDALLVHWPADMLALQVGHQLDFFLGDAQNLRDRVGRSLYAIDPAHPHYALALGMHAFGLEESGHYDRSEETGLAALDTNPDDVWAVHAVVHTYEMRGEVDNGIRFLRGREADWATGNLFTVHNWWHLALYLLEAGRPADALAIYDAHIHNADALGVPLEMLDGSALLWRLLLDGADTGGRFSPLADAWATRTHDEPWYVFNDLHAVMALCGAGRVDEAKAVVDRLGRFLVAAPDPSASNVRMTAEVGLPACRAAVAFVEQRDADVVAALLRIRRVLHRFGGSHAQRDALQRTLLVAATRGGDVDLARALVSERLSVRESSVYAWTRQAEILRAAGDAPGAAVAEANAEMNRARFAAALS